MRIEVIASAAEAGDRRRFSGRTAIVIDVLRATSTIVTALEAGACAVVPAESPEEALRLRRSGDLLGGERQCRRIEGFDLGNSPLEYTAKAVAGRRIVLSTTNGTLALRRAAGAEDVLAACLLNAGACAEAAAALGRDVVIVCAGCEGAYSLEDGFAAGCLITLLDRWTEGRSSCDDFGVSLKWLYARQAVEPESLLARTGAGRRLQAIGLEADIAACARLDALRIVPRLCGGELIPVSASAPVV